MLQGPPNTHQPTIIADRRQLAAVCREARGDAAHPLCVAVAARRESHPGQPSGRGPLFGELC